MERSQRKVSGQESSGSGRRLNLLVALTLAVSVVGFIAYAAINHGSDALPAQVSGVGCDRAHASDSLDTQNCTSALGQVADEGQSNSSLSFFNELFTNSPDAPGTRDGRAENLRLRQRAENPRAGISHQAISGTLRPGYTMAELCAAGSDYQPFRCQTGHYGEITRAASAVSASDSESDHVISGHVWTTEGVGLEGIKIVASPERLKNKKLGGKLISASESLRFWTVTDAFGAYSLDGLPDGEYTIRSGARGLYGSARISARAGVDYADLVVSRKLSTVVEGRVLASDGQALEGVTVLPDLPGQPSVLTDDDGRFRLPVAFKPTIDSITLRFQRPGYREQAGTVNVQRFGAPHAADVNIVMYPVESWTSLRGSIYSEQGEPLAGLVVELRPRSAQQTYKAKTDGDGQYIFPIVESPADYQLIVYGGASYKDHEQAVHVTADLDELDVITESYEFGAVTGQLVNQSGMPVRDFELVLRNTASRAPNALVSTDELGNFEITDAPAGEFVMASQSTPSILVQGLALRPGDKLHLPLVLDWGQHEIRGVVLDAHGYPVPASRIVLQWSHEAGGITTLTTRRTAADTQGQFTFSNLGPGPHSLQIAAPGFSTVGIDHDLSRQGYDVTVKLKNNY